MAMQAPKPVLLSPAWATGKSKEEIFDTITGIWSTPDWQRRESERIWRESCDCTGCDWGRGDQHCYKTAAYYGEHWIEGDTLPDSGDESDCSMTSTTALYQESDHEKRERELEAYKQAHPERLKECAPETRATILAAIAMAVGIPGCQGIADKLAWRYRY